MTECKRKRQNASVCNGLARVSACYYADVRGVCHTLHWLHFISIGESVTHVCIQEKNDHQGIGTHHNSTREVDLRQVSLCILASKDDSKLNTTTLIPLKCNAVSVSMCRQLSRQKSIVPIAQIMPPYTGISSIPQSMTDTITAHLISGRYHISHAVSGNMPVRGKVSHTYYWLPFALRIHWLLCTSSTKSPPLARQTSCN